MPIDEMLVGHWLHTDSMSSDQVTMVTDTHYILGQDGRFEYYTKTQDSFGSGGDGPYYGNWQAEKGRLIIQIDHGETINTPYQVEPDKLFLPEESHYRLWYRV